MNLFLFTHSTLPSEPLFKNTSITKRDGLFIETALQRSSHSTKISDIWVQFRVINTTFTNWLWLPLHKLQCSHRFLNTGPLYTLPLSTGLRQTRKTRITENFWYVTFLFKCGIYESAHYNFTDIIFFYLSQLLWAAFQKILFKYKNCYYFLITSFLWLELVVPFQFCTVAL